MYDIFKIFDSIKEKLNSSSYSAKLLDSECKYINLDSAIDIINEAENKVLEKEFSEWCTDCKEYDKEKHYCERYCKVIRSSVEELVEAYATAEDVPIIHGKVELEIHDKKIRDKVIDELMTKVADNFGTGDEVVIEHFDLKQLAEEIKGGSIW